METNETPVNYEYDITQPTTNVNVVSITSEQGDLQDLLITSSWQIVGILIPKKGMISSR